MSGAEKKDSKKVLVAANSRCATVTNTRVLREHVATMTTKMAGDPIAVCWQDVSLRVSDVQKLQGPHAINERIVSFYMKYIESKFQQADIAFIAPEDTDCMLNQPAWQIKPFFEALELNSKKFIFLVFTDEEGHLGAATSSQNKHHFTLIVFSRPEETFYYYDRCGKNQKDATPLTMSFISELYTVTNCKRFLHKMLRGQHLPNTQHDCGIRMITMMEHVANHVYHFERIHGIDLLHQNAVSDKRMQILTVVHKVSEAVSTKANKKPQPT